MRTAIIAAGTLVISTLTFAAGFAVSKPSEEQRLNDAFALVERDTAHLVCDSADPCYKIGRATLLVYFSLQDCAIGLYETVVLDSLYRRRKDNLNIIGIAEGGSTQEVKNFARTSGITFPIYTDPRRMERIYLNPRTEGGNKPMKVLLGNGGQATHMHESGSTVSDHHNYAASLSHSLDRLQEGVQ